MKVLGVDASPTSTGLAALQAQEGGAKQDMRWCERAIQIKGRDGIDRGVRQVEVFDEVLVALAPELVVFEGYAFVRKNTIRQTIEVGTCLRLACRRRNVPILEVAPLQLKKFVTGLGKGKKDMMRLHVFKRWGYENDCDDIVDAFALAQVGLAFLGEKPETLTAKQLEVVGVLHKTGLEWAPEKVALKFPGPSPIGVD